MENSETLLERFEYVLLTDAQRQQIIDTFHPSSSYAFSCDNLNLVYGVRSKTSDFVMTLVYYLSDSIKRCDEPDDYEFILLWPGHAQIITCKRERGRNDLTLCRRLGNSLREEVLEALAFYEDGPRWEFLDRVFGGEHSYSKYSDKNKEYIGKLVLEPEREKKQKKDAEEQAAEKGQAGDGGRKSFGIGGRIRELLRLFKL